jgi:hypothetical protein
MLETTFYEFHASLFLTKLLQENLLETLRLDFGEMLFLNLMMGDF